MGDYSVFGLTREYALALLIQTNQKNILNIIYKFTLNFVYGFMLWAINSIFDVSTWSHPHPYKTINKTINSK